MHFLGPAPNGRNDISCRFLATSSLNLSGSKTSGFGKYFGSLCIPKTEIITSTFFGIVTPIFSKVYSVSDLLSNKLIEGYSLKASVK